MRLLFCSRPAYGHLYPMMPLALAARAAGHEVAFATGGRFVAMLRSLGFPAIAVGISSADGRAELLGGADDAMPRGADGRPDLELAARLFIEVLGGRTATDLAPRMEALAPDVVVYDQGEFGAAVVAGARGIPTACHAISPRTAVAAIEPASRGHLARLWAAQGVTTSPFDAFTGDVYLDVVPDVLQHEAFTADPARLTVRPTPWSEPGAALPGWVGERRRPLVYLTLGTVVGTAGDLAPAVAALATLDADVLVALGSAPTGALEHVPANVHVEAFVDQAAVLRHADLVVHHGGSGTVLGALAHGRRQLLLPKGADQFLNADALRASGMAQVLEPAAATEQAIATAARAALAAPVPAAVLGARAEIAAMRAPDAALAALLDRLVEHP